MELDKILKAVQEALDEVEGDILQDIKSQPDKRDALLAQLDVLPRLKARLNIWTGDSDE